MRCCCQYNVLRVTISSSPLILSFQTSSGKTGFRKELKTPHLLQKSSASGVGKNYWSSHCDSILEMVQLLSHQHGFIRFRSHHRLSHLANSNIVTNIGIPISHSCKWTFPEVKWKSPVKRTDGISTTRPQIKILLRPDKDFDVTQATYYFRISSDFMQIMDRDGEDQKLMGDFGKRYKLLSTSLINS